MELTASQQELKGVMFVNTSGNTIDLQDIKMSAGVPPTAGTFLQWYDPSNAQYTKVYWVKLCDENDEDIVDEDGNPVLGWGDSDWYEQSKTLSAGEAFWVKPNNAAKNPEIMFPNALKKNN